MSKHVSRMSMAEQKALADKLQTAAIEWAKENDFSGLSEADSFNFYRAVQDAIKSEWQKAKRHPR